MRRRAGMLAAAVALISGIAAAPASGAGSGRNGEIAYTSESLAYTTPQLHAEVVAVQPDGSGRHTVATGPDYEGTPSWSPDGKRLAFVRSALTGGFRIFLTSGAPATEHEAVGRGASPAWSPEGKQLAWRNPSGSELKISNLDGSGVHTVADDAVGVDRPAWSPDGTRLAYSKRRSGSADHDIVIVDVTTGAKTTVAASSAQDSEPSWSPDGTRIAFMTRRDSDIPTIWTVSASGGPATQLTHASDTARGDTRPAWSPDGERIAFIGAREVSQDLWVMNVDGTGATNISRSPDENDNEPDWQPIPVASAVSAPAALSGTTIADSGLAATTTCAATCKVTAELLISRADAQALHVAAVRTTPVVIGRASGKRAGAGKVSLRVRLTRRAAKHIRHGPRLSATLRTTVVSRGERSVVPRRIKLR